MIVLAIILLLAGFFFMTVAAIGVLRFPDFYTRIHASGKADTLGVFLSLLGLAVYEGPSLVSIKIILIAIFILVANPIGTHVLAKAAFRSGIKPWMKKGDKQK